MGNALSELIVQLDEEGILNTLYRNSITKISTTFCPEELTTTTNTNNVNNEDINSLPLKSLGGVFLTYVGMVILSLIVFSIRLIRTNNRNQRMKLKNKEKVRDRDVIPASTRHLGEDLASSGVYEKSTVTHY